jgi:hypothetical protein
MPRVLCDRVLVNSGFRPSWHAPPRVPQEVDTQRRAELQRSILELARCNKTISLVDDSPIAEREREPEQGVETIDLVQPVCGEERVDDATVRALSLDDDEVVIEGSGDEGLEEGSSDGEMTDESEESEEEEEELRHEDVVGPNGETFSDVQVELLEDLWDDESHDTNEVIAQAFNVDLRREDVLCLRDGTFVCACLT